jgi:hypothetical protein
MSKTLLLLKLLRGAELRSRSLLGRQSVYATLQLNAEVEVRSLLCRDGGDNPEFNQLFIVELGPWWKGKEIVVQLFAKNRVRNDSFIGGCSCKLGELVRAVGLDEAAAAAEQQQQQQLYQQQQQPGGFGAAGPGGSYGHGPDAAGGGGGSGLNGSAGNAAAAGVSGDMSPSPPPGVVLMASAGGPAANLAPAPGKIAFQRVSASEVRQFGELLPVLPGGDDGQDYNNEEQQSPAGSAAASSAGEHAAAGAASPALAASSSSSSSSLPSAVAAGSATGSKTAPVTRGRPRSGTIAASPLLPITWLIMRHGGGPAALKQYPPPLWHLPAGRLAVYLDYIVLPPSSIPRVISGSNGTSTPTQHRASLPPGSAGSSPHRPAVSLPSSILPNGWPSMSDNEKLSWAYAHRRARSAPVPAPMGGLVASIARGLLGAGVGGGAGPGGAAPFSAPVYGAGGHGPGGPAGSGVAGSAAAAVLDASNWPFPWSVLRSWLLQFQASHAPDRVFYSWYFVLGAVVLAQEAMFVRPAPRQEWGWWGWAGPSPTNAATTAAAAAASAAAAAVTKLLPPSDPLGLVMFDGSAPGPVAAAAAAAQLAPPDVEPGWLSGYVGGTHLLSLSLGVLVLKLGWNMLHEQQISQPWRRLDLVLTLLLGVALGSATQLGPSGSSATRVLGMAALAVCHAYARATLYQADVVAGVMWERRGGGRVSPPAAFVRGHVDAVMRWTARSLAVAYEVGLAWITGKATRTVQQQLQPAGGAAGAANPAAAAAVAAAAAARQGIPGSVQLCLRSAFFLIGQVMARWVLLPLPARVACWLPSLTSSAAACLAGPLFGFLLLFLLGKDSPTLKGKPWLVLFVLNATAMLLASLWFLPPLLGLLTSALALTLWAHKWALLALPLEWALSAYFVPQAVWEQASGGVHGGAGGGGMDGAGGPGSGAPPSSSSSASAASGAPSSSSSSHHAHRRASLMHAPRPPSHGAMPGMRAEGAAASVGAHQQRRASHIYPPPAAGGSPHGVHPVFDARY